jgi:hypothetical protein
LSTSVVRVYLSGDPTHDRCLKAIYEGCPEEKELVSGFDYKPSDIAVVWGMRKSKVPKSFPRGAVFSQQRTNNLDVLVLDTGYVNRGAGDKHHYAAGINGLNGRAYFGFDDWGVPASLEKDETRWEKLGVELKPWRTDGEHIVLCSQVPWDASVEGTDHIEWLLRTVSTLKKLTGREVRFRPHPLAPLPPLKGLEYSTAPLADDLINAWATVTFNSNSGVESAIAGVPIFTDDAGAMGREISSALLARIENPYLPERKYWAWNLAWCQWTPEEMANGETWKHLFPSPSRI